LCVKYISTLISDLPNPGAGLGQNHNANKVVLDLDGSETVQGRSGAEDEIVHESALNHIQSSRIRTGDRMRNGWIKEN
jgi:hypothetical protein